MSGHSCTDLAVLLGAFADAEIGGEDAVRVRTHLADCDACRRTLRTLARLNLEVAQAPAPPVPPELADRVRRGLSQAVAERRRRSLLRWASAATAAMFLVAVGLVLVPQTAGAEVPHFVRATAEAHRAMVAGGREFDARPDALAEYFRTKLNAEVACPVLADGACCEGGCCCELPGLPGRKDTIPWIVYRRGSTPISLLTLPSGSAVLPAAARRTRQGREYYLFRDRGHAVICCPSGDACHVWIADLPEAEFLDLILETPEGRKAFSGERISISGVTCRACCATAELAAKRVPGVRDARVDLETMHVIIAGEGTLDLDAVIRSLKEAGFDARR